jgi:hypothetical protein
MSLPIAGGLAAASLAAKIIMIEAECAIGWWVGRGGRLRCLVGNQCKGTLAGGTEAVTGIGGRENWVRLCEPTVAVEGPVKRRWQSRLRGRG